MSFKYSAFHENTPEAREWLESIGYMQSYFFNNTRDPVIKTQANGKYFMTTATSYTRKVVDCRENLPLFKAISAMRDDAGLHQWHIADSDIYFLWSDAAGNDHCGTVSKGRVFLWDLCTEHSNVFRGDFHKMDLDELINHFKK